MKRSEVTVKQMKMTPEKMRAAIERANINIANGIIWKDPKANHASEIQALRDKIRIHNRKYYIENAPELSDAAYDLLMKRLECFESEWPELITHDSPTQIVGAGYNQGEDEPEWIKLNR